MIHDLADLVIVRGRDEKGRLLLAVPLGLEEQVLDAVEHDEGGIVVLA